MGEVTTLAHSRSLQEDLDPAARWVDTSVNKANQMLGLVKRIFSSFTKETFPLLNQTPII